ncbi:MAG: hypothetical protein ACKOW8_10910, partial [Flavobacteriales bacterium]
MKKILHSFIALSLSLNVAAQNVDIPDPALFNELLAYYDADMDGAISITEAESVTELFLGEGFGDLTGLEAFINVQSFGFFNGLYTGSEILDLNIFPSLTSLDFLADAESGLSAVNHPSLTYCNSG